MSLFGKKIKKDPGTSPSYRTVCPCGTRIVPGSSHEIILFYLNLQANFMLILNFYLENFVGFKALRLKKIALSADNE